MKTKILILLVIIVGAHCNVSLQAQDTIPDIIWSVEFGDNQIPYDAKFSPDGTIVAHGMNEGRIQIRSADDGALIKQFAFGHGSWPITNIEFSPDGQFLFTGGGDGTASNTPYVRMWDLSADTIIKTFYPDNEFEDKTSVESMDISHDGTKLGAIVLRTQIGHYLEIWDINSGTILKSINFGGWKHILEFSPDGKYLAITDGDDEGNCFEVKLYDANTFVYKGGFKGGCSEQQINDIAFSPDGNLMGTVGDDNDIKIYDLENKNILKLFKKITNIGNLNNLHFNSSSEFIITAGNGYEKLKIWKIEDTSLVYTYPWIGLGSFGVELKFDSNKILATGGGIYLLNSKFDVISVEEETVGIEINYPNPTNGFVNLIFELNTPTDLNFNLYDMTGTLVSNLKSEFYYAGLINENLILRNLANGIYYLKIESLQFNKTYKLIINK